MLRGDGLVQYLKLTPDNLRIYCEGCVSSLLLMSYPPGESDPERVVREIAAFRQAHAQCQESAA